MLCATGCTCIAREPKLRVGHKGRASSQRPPVYHNCSVRLQRSYGRKRDYPLARYLRARKMIYSPTSVSPTQIRRFRRRIRRKSWPENPGFEGPSLRRGPPQAGDLRMTMEHRDDWRGGRKRGCCYWLRLTASATRAVRLHPKLDTHRRAGVSKYTNDRYAKIRKGKNAATTIPSCNQGDKCSLSRLENIQPSNNK